MALPAERQQSFGFEPQARGPFRTGYPHDQRTVIFQVAMNHLGRQRRRQTRADMVGQPDFCAGAGRQTAQIRIGGADQFGPLLIGADMVNREQTETDPVGVNIFGWIAAVAVGVGMLGILVWNFVIGRQDREVRRQRNAREAEELKLPE